MKPALKTGVDKGIGDVLLDNVFMLKGSEKGLELNARLTGPKWRARSSGDVADMNDRCAPASPSAQKF